MLLSFCYHFCPQARQLDRQHRKGFGRTQHVITGCHQQTTSHGKHTQARHEREAERIRARIEETIRLLNTGRVSIPPEATSRSDTLQYILSGGALTQRPRLSKDADLKAVLDEYFETYIIGKESATVEGERIHVNHFKRLLGDGTVFGQIDTDKLQTYAVKRCKEKGLRGRKLSHETVKKEFRTFNQIWKMAVARG